MLLVLDAVTVAWRSCLQGGAPWKVVGPGPDSCWALLLVIPLRGDWVRQTACPMPPSEGVHLVQSLSDC